MYRFIIILAWILEPSLGQISILRSSDGRPCLYAFTTEKLTYDDYDHWKLRSKIMAVVTELEREAVEAVALAVVIWNELEYWVSVVVVVIYG